jgi:hypothetical protein
VEGSNTSTMEAISLLDDEIAPCGAVRNLRASVCLSCASASLNAERR